MGKRGTRIAAGGEGLDEEAVGGLGPGRNLHGAPRLALGLQPVPGPEGEAPQGRFHRGGEAREALRLLELPFLEGHGIVEVEAFEEFAAIGEGCLVQDIAGRLAALPASLALKGLFRQGEALPREDGEAGGVIGELKVGQQPQEAIRALDQVPPRCAGGVVYRLPEALPRLLRREFRPQEARRGRPAQGLGPAGKVVKQRRGLPP